ncbi:hypothetical protein I317_02086 [Kwoniella heveanensis CBS 569]|nr:hypothetical protein I317_02086 [Kwoniella heveanensis CBS 569]
MSHLFPQQSGGAPSYSPYGSSSEPLAFFGSSPAQASGSQGHTQGYYGGSRPSLEGNMGGFAGGVGGGATGNMNMAASGRMLAGEGRWWEAFGTGGFEGEPSLMEELGINPSHILQKSLTVLNPLSKVDANIMDDADLAGPLVFSFAFAFFLLLLALSITIFPYYHRIL